MKEYLVKPGEKLNLSKIDPNDCGEWEVRKKEAKRHLSDLLKKLDTLQEILHAEHKHRILIILQAMDAGGKDGTIRSVFEGVNPQGVRVVNFKVPTITELDRDYLWRVHSQVPAKGEIVIFNRSHYEDVLVVRVHNLVPNNIWEKRYKHMVEFERMLADEGTTILKFFLYIDREEQKQRFLARLNEPGKQWKFNPKDVDERKFWDDYMQAFETMLEKTSTSFAPWYVVPANYNWYRNLIVTNTLVEKLKKLNMKYPALVGDIQAFKKAVQNS